MPPASPTDRERRPQRRDVASLFANDEHAYLVIGEVMAPRGVHGELRVGIISDLPERFLDLASVYVGEQRTLYRVRRSRLHQQWALVELEGIDDRDAAEALRGELLWVSRDQAIALKDGEYFLFEILGLSVLDEVGNEIGRVAEVLSTGANDVYVVRTAEGELLIPAIRDVIKAVDLQAGQMRVSIPDGLR